MRNVKRGGLSVSIIVPVYNEEERLPNFLDNLLKFLKKLHDYEVIFVNDGSQDNTLKIMQEAKRKNKNIKIISYKINRGKGYAVKQGIILSKGKKIMFIDADGSIHPNQIPKLLVKLDSYDIVVGNRRSEKSDVKMTPSRWFIGSVFNLYVAVIFSSPPRDNLCGFKGFKANVAKDLFKDMISERWLFDVELFYKIKKKEYSLYDLPIEWINMPGTKMKLTDPFKMLYQLIYLRIKLVRKG